MDSQSSTVSVLDGSQSQPSQNELTQMADMDECEELSFASPPCASPDAPINPLDIPWGRLVPCRRGGDFGNAKIDLFPRDPIPNLPSAATTRSKSLEYQQQQQQQQKQQHLEKGISFLGLHNLKASDRFNEYVVGRSARCDVVASKRYPAPKDQDWIHSMVSNRHCRIFSMLKNPVLSATPSTSTSILNDNATKSATGQTMEVYIEDSSGNGTLINNTTLLKRGERRILHTGDTLSLLNPDTFRKKIRSELQQKEILTHYSFIFINVHQTQAGFTTRNPLGHTRISSRSLQQMRQRLFSPNTATKSAIETATATKDENEKDTANANINIHETSAFRKCHNRAAVDARATNANSPPNKHNYIPPPPPITTTQSKSTFNMPPPEKKMRLSNHTPKTQTQQQQQQQQPPPSIKSRTATKRVEEFYDLRDLLGSGISGEVRRAIHRRTGEWVAVKIIPTATVGGRNRTAPGRRLDSDSSIQAEAAILQNLQHPYIVQLLDIFIHPGTAIYLVMELVHGGDLFDRIVAKGRYTETESRRVMRRMLAAVHYLHEDRNIVHRDLKPENILCVSRSNDVTVKLADFGVAKSVTEDGLKTFCGTPQYFAPEVLRRQHTVAGRGRYGKEADMWSLGVICYILLSGVPPFDVSDSMDVVADANITFKPSRWNGISAEAKDLVSQLLVKDPNHRLSVVDACRHKWVLMEDGDTHTHPLDDPALPPRNMNDSTHDYDCTEQKQDVPNIHQPCLSPCRDNPNNGTPLKYSSSPPAPQSVLTSPSPHGTKSNFPTSDAVSLQFQNTPSPIDKTKVIDTFDSPPCHPAKTKATNEDIRNNVPKEDIDDALKEEIDKAPASSIKTTPRVSIFKDNVGNEEVSPISPIQSANLPPSPKVTNHYENDYPKKDSLFSCVRQLSSEEKKGVSGISPVEHACKTNENRQPVKPLKLEPLTSSNITKNLLTVMPVSTKIKSPDKKKSKGAVKIPPISEHSSTQKRIPMQTLIELEKNLSKEKLTTSNLVSLKPKSLELSDDEIESEFSEAGLTNDSIRSFGDVDMNSKGTTCNDKSSAPISTSCQLFQEVTTKVPSVNKTQTERRKDANQGNNGKTTKGKKKNDATSISGMPNSNHSPNKNADVELKGKQTTLSSWFKKK